MQISQGLQSRNSQKFARFYSALTETRAPVGKITEPSLHFSRLRDCCGYPKIHRQGAGRFGIQYASHRAALSARI